MSEYSEYHSSFSADEVQQTLLSVQDKASKSAVLASIPADPTTVTDEHIASVRLIISELQKITDFHKGQGLADAVAAISDNNLFSDNNLAKLDKMDGSARGIVADIAQRDIKFDDPNTMSQGDYILVVSDAGGYPSFQYWDITTDSWNDVYRSTGSSSTNIAAAGTGEVAVFERASARSAKYIITATRGTVTQMWDVRVAHDGPGDNVFVSTTNEFKAPSSSVRLASFTATRSPDGSLIALSATTTDTNVTIDLQRVALL